MCLIINFSCWPQNNSGNQLNAIFILTTWINYCVHSALLFNFTLPIFLHSNLTVSILKMPFTGGISFSLIEMNHLKWFYSVLWQVIQYKMTNTFWKPFLFFSFLNSEILKEKNEKKFLKIQPLKSLFFRKF